MKIQRCTQNPIIKPGTEDWRNVVTFNPGALYENGKFYLYERAAGSLSPFRTHIGLLESRDGIHFSLVKDSPVFTSEMIGYPEGSVQDARIVKIEDLYYMSYAMQPFGFDCHPNGKGIPLYDTGKYPGWEKREYPMITQSGIAISKNRVDFDHLCYTSPKEIDDRDHVLFPEKIGNRFVLLRRPIKFVGKKYGTDRPGIWLTSSEDLVNWSDPFLIATSKYDWEGEKIGAATNPLKTKEGWLILYHGVDDNSVYRVGALLLDLEDPRKVRARTKKFIMEPTEDYEKEGLVIPNVIFPTSMVNKDGIAYIYYGCCDSCISLATLAIDELVSYLLIEEPIV